MSQDIGMEINCAMNVTDNVTEKEEEADIETPQVPKDFICIDPAQQYLVFDYLRNFDKNIKEQALIHLRLCLHCREAAEVVLKINKYLEPGSGRWLHGKKSKVAAKAEKISSMAAGDSEAELCEQDSEGDEEADFASNPTR